MTSKITNLKKFC